MTPLSAVIITLNEADNIGRCLQSLASVTDEIIVVDSFSTDKTEAICKEHGVRFIQREWAGYSDSKNWANAQATHQYILSIDADEEVDDALKNAILEARKTGLKGAYMLNRKTNYCGSWVRFGGWYPDRKVRIFDRREGKWEGEFVHETLTIDANISIQQLPGHLNHYSYHTLADHHERAVRYATLHAKKMHSVGKTAGKTRAYLSAFWKFVQTYFLKLGVLDGWAGWHIARLSAKAVYLKYQKLIELQQNKTHAHNS